MTTCGKTIRIGVAAVLMLVGITTGAQGDVGVTPGSFGPGGEWQIQIKGNVVCAGCSLAEVQEALPSESNLYQLTHRQGQVVMKVNRVSSSRQWNHLTVPRIWVRAEDSLFQELSAEENLFKEVEITGILSPSQILDIGSLTIPGPSAAEQRAEAAAQRAEVAVVRAEAAARRAEIAAVQAERGEQRVEAMEQRAEARFRITSRRFRFR